MRNSSGMTLVSVLIATALIGLIAVILATLFSMMAGYMTRTTAQTDIDQAVSYIYGVLADRNLCDNALRSGGGAVTWDFNLTLLQPVERIEVDPDGPGGVAPTIAVQTPKIFSPSLTLLSMNLREPDPTKGEPGKVRTTVVKSGATYDSVSARLVLDFKTPDNLTGGILRERYINLTLGLDRATHVIKFCYPQPDASLSQFVCNQATILAQAPPNNVDCPAAPNPYCKALYYVSQFQNAGNPICSCQWVCPPTVNIYHPEAGGVGGTGGGVY